MEEQGSRNGREMEDGGEIEEDRQEMEEKGGG